MFTDLFAELLPLNVRHAMSAYENRRNELVNYEISNLREMTQLLNRYIFVKRSAIFQVELCRFLVKRI